MLHLSWFRSWNGLHAVGDGVTLMNKLIAAYEEPQRQYHTLQHLTECFTLLAPNLHIAEYPAEVEVALWFHDAIYDIKAQDNEARSANWATKELSAAQVSQESIQRVEQLIMATCHAALPDGQDQKLLVDIDLAILGAPRHRFLEYEAQVRKEYQWVPDILFRQKRREILKQFLARDPIYNTPEIQQAIESQARENLAYSVKRLGG
jgi:predicted metal-dependent HD superfamily phosphohydrolase